MATPITQELHTIQPTAGLNWKFPKKFEVILTVPPLRSDWVHTICFNIFLFLVFNILFNIFVNIFFWNLKFSPSLPWDRIECPRAESAPSAHGGSAQAATLSWCKLIVFTFYLVNSGSHCASLWDVFTCYTWSLRASGLDHKHCQRHNGPRVLTL